MKTTPVLWLTMQHACVRNKMRGSCRACNGAANFFTSVGKFSRLSRTPTSNRA